MIFEATICLFSRFQDASRKVHAMRVLFQAKEQLAGLRGAIDESRLERLESFQVITVDMAEETGERGWFIRVICEVVYADVWKLSDDTVKGRHLIMHFI